MSVSVVILTKNSERTIGPCLNSILESSLRPRRVVIVDGGSKDRTLEVVKQTLGGKLDYRVLMDEGRGLGYARDIGWRNTEEDYVAMVDSDVIVHPSFFREGAALMDKDTSIGGLSAKLKPVCEERGWLARFQLKCYATHLHLNEATYPFKVISLHTGCTLLRKDALKNINGFDHEFKLCQEDSDVSFRLRKAGYSLCYLNLTSTHIETGKRFFRTNFRYGNIFRLFRKYAIPLWTTKRKVLTMALFAPLLQYLVYAIYAYKYSKLNLTPTEKLVLPLLETIRQALRTAGLIYYLVTE